MPRKINKRKSIQAEKRKAAAAAAAEEARKNKRWPGTRRMHAIADYHSSQHVLASLLIASAAFPALKGPAHD